GDSTVTRKIEKSYTVIPEPNSAVISADKMNVVYRGVKNPMTVTIPRATNVTAKAPGMDRVKGSQYVLDPTNIQAREETITATGKLPGGKQISRKGKFRIIDIPRPVGTVRGEDGGGGPVKMQRNGLNIS